jgi:hypothetical protein
MESENRTPNALTPLPIDGFGDIADASASPLRGISFRFKDGDYLAYSEPFPVKGRTFAAIDKADGWQKLAEGVPPEYLMRQPGQLRPPQPHVDKKDWPLDLNGQSTHPWRLTRYLYLLDTATGEISTFWSNTIGGKVAFNELSDQVKFMRGEHPDAVPIIALESTMMPTQFGSKKARPYFRIVGYKLRSHIGSQNLLTDETKAETPVVEVEKPPFNDDLPDFAKAPSVETSKKTRSKK